MRLDIGHKLGGTILLLAFVAVGLSAFAIVQADHEQRRIDRIDSIASLAKRADGLADMAQMAVIDADAVAFATSREDARAKLVALQGTQAALDRMRVPFFEAIGSRLSAEEKTALGLRLREFQAYQADTASLGMTVSPQAAQIQASDPAVVANREAMVRSLQAMRDGLEATVASERATVGALRAQARSLLLAVPVSTILIGFFASVWIVRTQVQTPLVRLRRSMQTLADGTLDIAVPYLDKQDEIGDMAASIAVFQRALRDSREADGLLRARAGDDLRRAETIVRTTQAFETVAVGLMAELSSSVRSMDEAARAVASASHETQDEAGVVGRAAQGATAILTSVSTAADELSHAAAALSQDMRTTIAVAASARDEAAATTAKVTSLVEAAQEIGGAAKLIDDIACRTNLLALNATIEAARAGTAGRGFAVVAGEVKSLAQRTAEATAFIAGHIQLIQDVTTRTADGIAAIKATLDRMHDASASVAGAMVRQGRSSESIAAALAEATEQARIVSRSIGGVQGAAVANGARAQDLKTKAEWHGEQAAALTGCIAAFVGDMRRAA